MKYKTPIAVVGMAGLFPGAPDLEIFWQNLINKRNSVMEVPEDRWILPPDAIFFPEYREDKTFSKKACLINYDFGFDPKDFKIDSSLLTELDPLYHIVLHAGKKAFLNSNTQKVNKEKIGVSLAAIALPTDSSSSITREIFGKSFAYRLFQNNKNKNLNLDYFNQSKCLASRVTSLPGAVLAKALGLGGGSFTLDAACASSIYAVKLACDELQAGRADAMIAGGVSRPECLYTQVGFSQLRALSPSGICAPFDAASDGLVVGEGAGIFILKRLDDALAHDDNIYGLIQGIGLSNDMRGNLLAPDTKGQVRAMENAYKSAQWSPFDVDHIECHGAGTPVGDKTELSSLRTLWGSSGWNEGQCPIGSIKSMVGHLLTGAGAAGIIKTLLGLKYKALPPSLNFTKPHKDSPLNKSPFKVQTQAQDWVRRNSDTPRRAAVSAFGFGGINGHILFEEYRLENKKKFIISKNLSENVNEVCPIAVVGMEAVFGTLDSLKQFQEAVFNGCSCISKRPDHRWKGAENIIASQLNNLGLWGGYMEDISLYAGEFHIPPNEIPDILPQQLLMLKVAAKAMLDAGLKLREYRPDMGVTIGMEFDMEATNFHLRWNLYNEVKKWKQDFNLSDKEAEKWLESLQDQINPPLTPSRVLGALGGIVASRIAREFRFGGPSFVVSQEAGSGIKALEIGMRSLQQNETNAFLVGAVDLFGDLRNIITNSGIRPFTDKDKIYPFDKKADKTIPGEGAAALVLKRLDQALADNDRIYSVIKGISSAGGGGIDHHVPLAKTYKRSFEYALKDADLSLSNISYIETHGSGDVHEDRMETKALHEIFANETHVPAIGSTKANIGFTGAAAGLASVVKTSLCLYQEIIPPLANFQEPEKNLWNKEIFHIPGFSQFWFRDRKNGPRRACVSSITWDGNCSHVILEGRDYDSFEQISPQVIQEQKQPLGLYDSGLFIVEGNSSDELIHGLDLLDSHCEKYNHIYESARAWYTQNKLGFGSVSDKANYAVSIIAKNSSQLQAQIKDAKKAVLSGSPKKMTGPTGISYFPEPLGQKGELAFIFPGSGNHYVGMGRGIGVCWPEILREMDMENQEIKTCFLPKFYMPWRVSWNTGWQEDAHQKIISDPLNILFGQVSHGSLMTRLIKKFGINPDAVIGYSLGESSALFATGVWSDNQEMLKKMQSTDLFSKQLAGPCIAARTAWNIPDNEDFKWSAALVKQPVNKVKKIISKWPLSRLLIINTPYECVIGGKQEHVDEVIKELNCDAIVIDGIITVHCDAALPVADEYKNLHLFSVKQVENIRYYSCALERSYKLTKNNVADSILKQATDNFNFPATIEQAYEDGVRIFLEMGPQASCTRMINQILDNKHHSAMSVCVRGEDDYKTILKILGTLASERVVVNLDKLYGKDEYLPEIAHQELAKKHLGKKVVVKIGGISPLPVLPKIKDKQNNINSVSYKLKIIEKPVIKTEPDIFVDMKKQENKMPVFDKSDYVLPGNMEDTHFSPVNLFSDLIEPMTNNINSTAEAHKSFLDLSNQITKNFGNTFIFQNQLLEKMTHSVPEFLYQAAYDSDMESCCDEIESDNKIVVPDFPREMCMEFATGSVAKVLGPEFAVVDTYDVRVRLPDEPLMLVDRIMSVEGEKGSLGSGRVITQHDVLPDSWYLDGNKAPVCISVEAGQADLFLCSYLGIDLAVKGKRAYRLLDAKVRFHRGLPCPGEIIQYDIYIDKFVRQGETYMFFFRFEGTINGQPLISMRDGCAGFFTEQEVKNSGGIILTQQEKQFKTGKKDFTRLVPMSVENYDDNAVNDLRNGDSEKCFGSLFKNIKIPKSLRLPGGKMKLLDRILHLDPNGGRFGLGIIQAQADIHPDDWFLTCHFVDDMVMPGTLMYECCAHTLRIFLQRMGWVIDKPDVCYEPVVGVEAVLKCRGPVTPKTKHVVYEVEIKEIGYNPEPYVLADAIMYGDGDKIVSFKDMSMKLTGTTRNEIELFWLNKTSSRELYTKKQLLAFCQGNPSEAFGEPYKIFDNQRIIARLPRPPYFFMDRITVIEPEPWVLKPGGWIEAEYDISGDEWYFKADRSGFMAFCILLEIALQPCGWLAAYAGSALKSKIDVKFRNLGGSAVLHRSLSPQPATLTMRSRMTQVSEAGGMIIENFDMQVLQNGEMIYEGDTYFGFFSAQALANQVGIPGAKEKAWNPEDSDINKAQSFIFKDEAPITPDDLNLTHSKPLAMPSKTLRMIDSIQIYLPDGGPNGLGFIRGIKTIDVNEWFFYAHFYQDPVCPGSLGIESFIQLIKFAALEKWPHLADTHKFEMVTGHKHNWIYRGQVIQKNKKVEVDAVITKIEQTPVPAIYADGYLKVDGLYIYQMDNFGLKLVPIN